VIHGILFGSSGHDLRLGTSNIANYLGVGGVAAACAPRRTILRELFMNESRNTITSADSGVFWRPDP